MTFKNFICKGILVFIGLLLIGWLGQYIYVVNGEIDWFRLMLVYGLPVGIPHMFIIVPWHWDLSGILGMVALCVIVGGVFEGYTELYRVTKDKRVGENLRWMLDIFAKKVYNPDKKRQEVFFDKDWNTLIDLYSYGHDIETSWLIDRGLEILNDPAVTEKLSPITDTLAEQIYKIAYKDHSVINECERGVDNTTRVWWVQAESVLGFMNYYQKHPEKTEYFKAVQDIWEYIQTYMVDKRPGSEWFWDLDENKQPSDKKPIVEPWKCPYHNGRMCFEMINRL